MQKMRLLTVLLSAGHEPCLWPASRRAFPKPFMVLGGASLMERAIRQGQGCGARDVLVFAGRDELFLAQDVVERMHAPPSSCTYLCEPGRQGSASALALAALVCERRLGGDALLLVLHADRWIADDGAFGASVAQALDAARAGWLVVFEAAAAAPDARGLVRAPGPAPAPGAAPGIFCFSAQALISAMEHHAPEVLGAARDALAAARWDEGVNGAEGVEGAAGAMVSFEPRSFGMLPDVDLAAVVGRADRVRRVAAGFGWSEVGSWSAIAGTHAADAAGNTLAGAQAGAADVLVALDTCGTHVQLDGAAPRRVATVGLRDIVIVDTPDALLVAHKDCVGEVARVADILRIRRDETIEQPAVVHRPWGTFSSLSTDDGYKVKRITVKPGHSLSLQYHHQREEHWVVVRGRGVVQIGEVRHEARPGQYHHIPLMEKHRLTNNGTEELVLIEVQRGNYLGEDDIVRLVDSYGRL